MKVEVTYINLIIASLRQTYFRIMSYYCEVRWLSKGIMLKRFYAMKQAIQDLGKKRT